MALCKAETESESEAEEGYYTDFVQTLGIQTYASNTIFKDNQRRLLEEVKNVIPRSVILLQGGSRLHHYDTELVHEFNQESFFYWLFGILEPDCYASIDVRSGEVVLFLSKLDLDVEDLSGSNLSEDISLKSLYDIDKVYTHDRIDAELRSTQPDVVLLLGGTNPETGLPLLTAQFKNVYNIATDSELIYPIMANLRVIKTNEEISIMKHAGVILCEALKYIMLRIRPGNYEYQADAIFKHFCYFSAGCKLSTCFGRCAAGLNVLKLNYSAPMDKIIEDGDLCVLELGAKYCGYATKATITYPASGKFSLAQKLAYKVVLTVQSKVLLILRDGIGCVELQTYAQQILLEELKELGVVQGNINDMVCSGIATVFAPQGIIQLIGIDYNDVGGYIHDITPPPPCERWLPIMKTTRILEENMVISFSPACYFDIKRIGAALNDDIMGRFIQKETVEKYLEVGGVKVEDMVMVTGDGYQLLTHLPRSVKIIEYWLRQPVETYINKVVASSMFTKNITFEEADACEA